MLKNELANGISLDGEWEFALGEDPTWGVIQVPGCWENQGYSKFVDGPAIYRRSVFLPPEWAGKKLQIEFSAASYACSVFLNGQLVDQHLGLWTPFAVDITPAARFGQENSLEIIIFKPGNRYPMRSSLAGFLPDVATTFGGLWQSVRLTSFDAALEELNLTPDPITGNLVIRSQTYAIWPLQKPEWQVDIQEGNITVFSRRLTASHDGKLDLTVQVPEHKLWSPETPILYTCQVTLFNAGLPVARLARRTGFRKLSTRGNQLTLNDEPLMIRGILSWGWNPDQIAPTLSAAQARSEMQRVRSMGFNLVKLCLFVPDQVYLDMADEEGMLVWEEFPLWLPEVTPELRSQAPVEYQEITRLVRDHPSIVLYSLGCELSQVVDGELLGQLDTAVRSQVQNVLVCDNSGSGESYEGLDFDFADFTDYHPYYDIHYFEPLLDNWRRDWQISRPLIFGEFSDSDTFRDPEQVIQANSGVRPWWLTTDNPVTTWRVEAQAMLEAQERLKQADLPFSSDEISRISYAQSLVIRKYTLETLRKKNGMGGYIVTGLRDTPISTSGIWDDFNQPKWSTEDFLAINDQAVLSLDVGRRRIWRNGGDRPDYLDIHNFWSGEKVSWYVSLHTTGHPPSTESFLRWELNDLQGNMIQAGEMQVSHSITLGQPGQVGAIAEHLPEVKKATMFSLKASLQDGESLVQNRWPVWVYPKLTPLPADLVIYDPYHRLDEYGDWLNPVRRIEPGSESEQISGPGINNTVLATDLTGKLLEFVKMGGKVLLLQEGNGPFPARRQPFWREAVNLFYSHPLWNRFPHQGFSDLQFFGLAGDTVFDTNNLLQILPETDRQLPILRRFDARNFQVGDYIFEAHLKGGVLMACSLRLQGGAGGQPFGWQRNVAGAALLQAMLGYLVEANTSMRGKF